MLILLGLVNGSYGTIKDIIYPTSVKQNSMPETIIIYFSKYIGPQFFDQPDKYNWIPINARTMYSKRVSGTRTQYPLRLAYAITTHKVQGDTLDAGVICLGKSEKSLDQTFVQISRFKKLNQFLIQPFPFDRLQKIAKSNCLPGRIEEEKILKNKCINTLVRFAHLLE